MSQDDLKYWGDFILNLCLRYGVSVSISHRIAAVFVEALEDKLGLPPRLPIATLADAAELWPKAKNPQQQETTELASLREQVRRLRADLLRLHDATIILRNGMGGHNHWDNTQRHGAGCPICIAQQQARREAQKLIDQVGPSAVREQLEREGTK